ncbi:MAG TPA: methyl-accepting chemotaxis protein, partial [Pyrinomonadaceae bacterium]|nr:methyl-accepting chemotaxis protein [Pyrinomonadaceae bacterium]
MDSSLWNLLLKTCSAAGALLLLIATVILAFMLLGFTDDLLPAFLSLILGTILSSAALVGFVLTGARSKRQIESVEQALDQLADGRLVSSGETGEIFDHIRNVSDYLATSAARLASLTSNGRPVKIDASIDGDVLGEAIRAQETYLAAVEQDSEIGNTIRGDLAELVRLADSLVAFDLSVAWESRSPEAASAAEAFNTGITALRARVKGIRDSVVRLSSAASEFEEVAEQMLRSSNAQGTQIERSAGGIAGLARQMHGLEGRSADSLNRANELQLEITAGCKAADENVNVMAALRKQIQESLRKVKKLCERSQELGQLTQSIDELSERLSMLAMNSSLKYSQAGRYSIEAEQVADRCAKLA